VEVTTDEKKEEKNESSVEQKEDKVEPVVEK